MFCDVGRQMQRDVKRAIDSGTPTSAQAADVSVLLQTPNVVLCCVVGHSKAWLAEGALATRRCLLYPICSE